MGVLAAAQMERADLGVGSYPRIPFGTRGMVVTSPAPRSAWAPRAEPCTIFGSCDDISDAQWVYQKGWIKPRTDLQPQGLSEDDLVWVRLNAKNWDAPDCPLDLPDAADYDAAAVPRLRPCDVPAATRDTATCEACLQTRRGRRQTTPHSLVWGDCLRASRPLPTVAEVTEADGQSFLQEPRFEDVDPELRVPNLDQEDLLGEGHVELLAARLGSADQQPVVPLYSFAEAKQGRTTGAELPEPLECLPHAALALAMATSTAATWGTASSLMGDSTAEPPEDEFQDWDDLDSTFSVDDEFNIGSPITDDPEAENDEVKGQESEEEIKKDAEADLVGDEFEVPRKSPRRRRWRTPRRNPLGMAGFTCHVLLPFWCAMAATAGEETYHFENTDLEMLQQVAGPEPGKSIVPPEEIRRAVGRDLDAWILAAQAEHDSFVAKEAVQQATDREIKEYGKRPLPMLNVWSRTSEDHRKCRSCIAGNLQQLDPAAQRWTAQAEPSSIFTAAKLAAVRKWTVSKLDVKGAFLNAPIPEGELILVQPPKQWVDWGIVGKNVVWKLRRAVYGLRQSPKWWSDERDTRLRKLDFIVGTDSYRLQQNDADSQVWMIVKNPVRSGRETAR